MTVITLPQVETLDGLTFHDTGSGHLLSHRIELQYTAPGLPDVVHSLTLPMKEALYLRALLEQLVAQEGLEQRPGPGAQH